MNNAKHQLGKLLVYNQIIDARLQKLDELMAAATRTTSLPKDGVSTCGGGVHDRLGNQMAAMADLDNTINFYIDLRYDIMMDTMLLLSRMQKAKYRDALYMRYIIGMTYRQMQQKLGYESLKGVKKLCERALRAFETIMVEEALHSSLFSARE